MKRVKKPVDSGENGTLYGIALQPMADDTSLLAFPWGEADHSISVVGDSDQSADVLDG